MTTTRVALVGGTGKLGAIIAAVIDETDGFETVAVLGSSSDLAEIDGADLVVDASTPAVSIDVVRAAIERGRNVLVGTSGWSAERIALVRPLVDAAGTGAVFIPNFSLGSVIGTALAAAAAPFFPSIEIVETHRETKIDSPSGTAVRTAELIAAARQDAGPVESPYVDQRARGQQVASIPVHSLRRPGVIARQETILSGPGEALTLVHDTVEPAAAYGPGIRVALAAARDARGVIVGLDSLIDIGLRAPVAPSSAPVDEGGVPGQVARTTGGMSARIGVVVMAALLGLYVVLVGQRAWLLLTSGQPIGIVMGAALLVLPVIAVWAIWRELRFGVRAAALAERLEQEGGLPAEEIDVHPSGRPEREQADDLFPAYRADVEEHPDDWRAWFRLGLAYDGAGDRRRARQAIRRAIELERGR